MANTNGRRHEHPSSPRPPGASAEQLRRVCTPDEVPFASTAEVEPHPETLGQRRAFDALALAVDLPADGYNVFATGAPGTGKLRMIREWLEARAAQLPPPPDLVSLFDFLEPLRPLTVPVPTGRAHELATAVDRLVQDVEQSLTRAFESDPYRTRHRELHDDIDGRRNELLTALDARASEAGVALRLTPNGALTVPAAGGRPLTADEIRDMTPELRHRFEENVAALGEPVENTLVSLRDLEREMEERHAELTREVAHAAIGHLVARARDGWEDTPRVAAWLAALGEDAVDHVDVFRAEAEGEHAPALPFLAPLQQDVRALAARYAVNVLVANDPARGAPVIVASDPSFHALFGRLEYETSFGNVTTDHRRLRAGLVHRAAGGFLVLQADDVLTKPLVWPRLKDVIRTGALKIENPGAQYMVFPGVTLDPEPVDVRMRVVLVGDTRLYELLHELDDDLARLFKLRADFADDLPRDDEAIRAYAGVLARIARDRELPPLDRDAIAALVEHGSRLAGHRDRLSTSVRELADVATEAARDAKAAGAEAIGRAHVAGALEARRRRSDRLEERLREATLEGTVQVDLDGGVSGQVNGLAVAMVADHEFGHPVRITATVAPGEGEVVDIDREARLSGPIHAKGVLILSGYLAGRYFVDRPMTLRASIVFEQSYGPVEGDSASTAELLALLSALARVPVEQGIAVTGAVDQHGAVHAVGGINEKIEGFFDLCAAAGLTGRQGVVVPAANVPHLMLDERVVAAVREGAFSVWPVTTVDEALALVTGHPAAGELVRDRLAAFAEAAAGRGKPSGQLSPVRGSIA